MEDKNLINSKDSMDINELASLNDDISPELIEQLQQKLSQDAQSLNQESNTTEIEEQQVSFNVNDDTTLFEEPKVEKKEEPQKVKKNIDIGKNFDDNFLKKYKAKLNKQKTDNSKKDDKISDNTISSAAFPETNDSQNTEIEKISNGKITERKFSKRQKEYNDSLDFLDGNVKYSKYVIYIDPENIEFINSLTVKERKNLINKILKEQDDIALTKHRFKIINTVIKHAIIAILTVAVSIPIIYWTINTSIETTINSYQHSQSIFQTLYKKNGKISRDFNK